MTADPFPTGWFQVGWSEEFPPGQVHPLRYFSSDLVAYRGASGELHVLDAFCAHMGAHLGHGGEVVAECVRCPFHGWQWGPDGRNVAIPGGRPHKALRLRTWETREVAGLVLVWHHPRQEPPSWELPPFLSEGTAYHPPYPDAVRTWEVRFRPQVQVENAVDSAHFEFVHRASESPRIVSANADGPSYRVVQEITYGGGRTTTWLTPDGPTVGTLDIAIWGMGLAFTSFAGVDDSINLSATTPIDAARSSFRMTNWVPSIDERDEFSEGARRRIAEQVKQAERDFVIWEHMRYVERPPYTRQEAAHYRSFRRWAKDFYDTDSAPVGDVVS